MSHHTDLFVKVSNITKGNSIWAHFTATGCFPSQIQISRLIQKEDVQIEKLIARLLNQIYVVQPPMLPLRYDDAPPGEYEYSQPSTNIGGARPSAPWLPEHLHSLLTHP